MTVAPPLSLLRRGDPLADAARQWQILNQPFAADDVPAFDDFLRQHGQSPLLSHGVDVLQVNVGKLCNQTCRHCHVDAGPERREIMSRETLQDCLDLLDRAPLPTVDITGGAPEMNPHFEWFVREVRARGREVLDRSNLTILLAPGSTHLVDFLAEQRVQVIASLPCYLESNCDRQRGDGVFAKSIEALQRLNAVGYGRAEYGLSLSLVYNPVGPSLPPDQAQLETQYREQLRSRYGVEFTRLYTITNMPISRFLADLLESGRYEEYLHKLMAAYNPAAANGVMCRTTLSVDWQGRLYDCDFNQMLGLGVVPTAPQHVRDWQPANAAGRRIVTGRHCYGCTAAAGSSCQGAIATR